MIVSLASTFRYLSDINRADMTIPIANYEIYAENESKDRMVLDEQAIRHLDLTEVEGLSLQRE